MVEAVIAFELFLSSLIFMRAITPDFYLSIMDICFYSHFIRPRLLCIYEGFALMS